MPIYLFSNPKTNKIKHIFQEMNAEHTYSEDGVMFERVYTVPNATIDSQIDPFSSQKFIEKTGTMKGTLGEIWDYYPTNLNATAGLPGWVNHFAYNL